MSGERTLEVLQQTYGGLAKTTNPTVRLPFVLQGETVEGSVDGGHVCNVKASPARVSPQCPHFTHCGGCQYQMLSAAAQGDVKAEILRTLMHDAGVAFPADISVHTGPAYNYRNRIRLRVKLVNGQLRFGYNKRATTEFLAINECPIAAPLLWDCAQTLLRVAADNLDVAFWLNAAAEVELFVDDSLTKVQLTLLCAPRTKAKQGSIERCFAALQQAAHTVVGIGAVASDPRTGPTGRVLAEAGAPGLSYRVLEETYWVARGAFFQVNRFLLADLVRLVCESESGARSGDVAWDLYAGVGLFSRVLARSFARVVAVEANDVATSANTAALRKQGPTHEAVCATTFDFLTRALVQRERPQLIVLDPPRAGAGTEACALLLQIAAPEIVYVSCDPTTLTRDLQLLTRDYDIRALHVVDLFPQTFHLETVVVLKRRR